MAYTKAGRYSKISDSPTHSPEWTASGWAPGLSGKTGQVAVARGGRERQPAQASFLTAAEGQRRFPSRGFRFSHLSAGSRSAYLDYAPSGPTSPWPFLTCMTSRSVYQSSLWRIPSRPSRQKLWIRSRLGPTSLPFGVRHAGAEELHTTRDRVTGILSRDVNPRMLGKQRPP